MHNIPRFWIAEVSGSKRLWPMNQSGVRDYRLGLLNMRNSHSYRLGSIAGQRLYAAYFVDIPKIVGFLRIAYLDVVGRPAEAYLCGSELT
jgi:hypothetical protein